MSMNKRLKEASELIKQKGILSVKELTDHFNVSDMTIRRDLKMLEENGSFERFHGGIRYMDEQPLDKRGTYHKAEKQRLAEYCVSMIEPRDTIIFDSGTTTFQIAEALANSDIRDISVVTNSLNIAYRLRNVDGIALIMCGGEMRPKSEAFVGSTAREFLENIFVNKAFISGDITAKGFSTSNLSEAEIKKCIINASESSFVVADSSKFGKRSLYLFSNLESVHSIITDENVSEKWSEIVEKMGVNLKIIKNKKADI